MSIEFKIEGGILTFIDKETKAMTNLKSGYKYYFKKTVWPSEKTNIIMKIENMKIVPFNYVKIYEYFSSFSSYDILETKYITPIRENNQLEIFISLHCNSQSINAIIWLNFYYQINRPLSFCFIKNVYF